MKKYTNIDIFKYSLKNPEPIIDDFYIKKGSLLISDNPKVETNLVINNNDLLESIGVYSFSKKTNNKRLSEEAILMILEILKTNNINYSEFVSFWPVVDISYSTFLKLKEDDKKIVLKGILDKYIDLRHDLYSMYGYTPVTIQVSKDAKAHKENSSLALLKVSSILDAKGYLNKSTFTIENFISDRHKCYIDTDKQGKKLFKEILKHYGVRFLWTKSKDKKMPDFLIKKGEDIFIVEHKHIKEGGGGQDKQINEILSLISYKEINNNIHYVAFLDGTYFNLFLNADIKKDNKISNQLNNIYDYLSKNKNNYFVNTAGFKKIFY